MRRISIFVGLKTIESAVLLLIGIMLYFMGKWNPFSMEGVEDVWWHYVGCGILHTIIILGSGAIVGFLLYCLIKQNWEWSGRA